MRSLIEQAAFILEPPCSRRGREETERGRWGAVYVEETAGELYARCELQRQVLETQWTILEGLGFETEDVAGCVGQEKETPPQKRGRLVRLYAAGTGCYLLMNLLSPKVPGPMWWLGLDTHVRILTHVMQIG